MDGLPTSQSGQDLPPVQLTGQGIFTLVVFLIFGAALVNYPVSLPVPLPHAPGTHTPWSHIELGVVSAPLTGAVILSVVQILKSGAWRDGVVGWNSGISPWDVLALFFALAYMAVSVEASGLFRAAAVWVVRVASPTPGGGFTRLFIGLYGFWWLLGAFAGNDAVIISGSSFLVHLARSASMGEAMANASAWAQFTAANIASAVLVSGNPTNLVIAQSFDISFATYSAHMVLPSLASTAAALAPLMLLGYVPWLTPKSSSRFVSHEDRAEVTAQSRQHTASPSPSDTDTDKVTIHADRSSSPPSANQGNPDPAPSGAAIPQVDIQAAAVSSSVLVATLGALIGTSVSGASVHVTYIAAPGAGICLAHDLLADWRAQRQRIARFRTLTTSHGPESVGAPTVRPASPVAMGELAPSESLAQSKSIEASQLFSRRKSADIVDMARNVSLSPQNPEECVDPDQSTQIPNTTAHMDVIASGTTTSEDEPSRPDRRWLNRFGEGCNCACWTVVGPVARSTPGRWMEAMWTDWIGGRAPARMRLSRRWPRTSYVLARQPWTLLPFVYGVFVLIGALKQARIVDLFGEGIGKAIGQTLSRGPGDTARYPTRSVVAASMLVGAVGTVLCALAGTNIGATLLLAQALQSSSYRHHVHPPWAGDAAPAGLDVVEKAARYSIALAGNVGALAGTPAASLAGLLWTQALAHERVRISRRQFAVYSLLTCPLALVTGVLVVVASVVVVS